MNYEELMFEEFLAAQMKEKGITVKRLAESTGIAPNHLENMLHGNFEEMPSAPYFRGYLLRVGKVLDFDGEEWWRRMKKGVAVSNSGPSDQLPRNRFLKRSRPRWWWGFVAAALVAFPFLGFQFSRILGRPTLIITFPSTDPYTATATTITLQGWVRNADALYLSNGDAASAEEIPIAPDGTWQKIVLLQTGLNPFQLTAKKLLGGETTVTEQILYDPGPSASSSATSTTSPNFPVIHSEPNQPATGTYYE